MSLKRLEHIWPEEEGDYKIIQISTQNEPYLRFSKKLDGKEDDEFHLHIVKRFAEELGVLCEEIRSEHGMIPALPSGIEYRIVGMGKCYFNPEREIAAFYGNSGDYNKGIDINHLKWMEDFTVNKIFLMISSMR